MYYFAAFEGVRGGDGVQEVSSLGLYCSTRRFLLLLAAIWVSLLPYKRLSGIGFC